MFQLPDLPYPYDALEPFIDTETMHVHHDGHHATYVKNLNDVLAGQDKFLDMDIAELLKSLDQIPEEIRTKVKNNAGGHFHHSIFWTMLMPNGRGKPFGKLMEAINQTFGRLEIFQDKFNQSASTIFGSGWTWLAWDDGKLSIINTPNQDSLISQGQHPLIGIDLWEHAYYLKYKNKRANFTSAWWNIANWDEAEKRLQQKI